MRKYVVFLILIVTTLGCAPDTNRYITFESGKILPYSQAFCKYGVLLNNEGNNILGPDSKVIQCTGYVDLTKEEAKQYEKFI